MKLKIFGLIILLVFCFGIVCTYAEESKEQMNYILEMVVCPSKAPEFEKALKTLKAAHEKHNYEAGYLTMVTDDFHYFFQIPIDNFAGIDNLGKIMADFSNKIGNENFQKLISNFDGTYKYYREWVATLKPDLSYLPENPRIKFEEVNYLFWNYWYLKPGTEEEMNRIWKEWIAHFQKNNIKDGWYGWVCGIGSEAPFYIATAYGKSDVDYYNTWRDIVKKVNPKSAEYWNKAMSLCRKFEQRTGMVRRDLSYTPKAE